MNKVISENYNELSFRIMHDILKGIGKIETKNIHRDGRINSKVIERAILKQIDLNIESASTLYENTKSSSTREWYDGYIKIKKNQMVIPYNIKYTKGNSSDNIGSKVSILWAYTQMPFEDIGKNSSESWEAFLKTLQANYIPEVNRNYFYIIVFDNGEVLLQSLRTLSHLTPNGNNLPCQVNWDKNKELKNYQDGHSLKRILDVLEKGLNSKKETTEKALKVLHEVRNVTSC